MSGFNSLVDVVIKNACEHGGYANGDRVGLDSILEYVDKTSDEYHKKLIRKQFARKNIGSIKFN